MQRRTNDPKTIRSLDDRKHNIPKLLKFNNIKRLGHKIRKLLIGGAIHKLNFPIENELLKKSQSNSESNPATKVLIEL